MTNRNTPLGDTPYSGLRWLVQFRISHRNPWKTVAAFSNAKQAREHVDEYRRSNRLESRIAEYYRGNWHEVMILSEEEAS